jgi:hypothetical protein
MATLGSRRAAPEELMCSSPRWFSLRTLLVSSSTRSGQGQQTAGLRGLRQRDQRGQPGHHGPGEHRRPVAADPAMRPPWLAVSAIAGSNAAPIRAPIWLVIWPVSLIKVPVPFPGLLHLPVSNWRPALSHL